MRLCIFALTEKGARLAQLMQRATENATVLLPEKGRGWSTPANGYFPRLSSAVPAAWRTYDGLIFIMATGIVVRTIAPLLQGKLFDPAVLVFDEQGTHGISLLSGHVGRANDLTRVLCKALGSAPVITTATDVEGVAAPDALASGLGLFPAPKKAIQIINSLLLEKKEIHWYVQKDMTHGDFYRKALARRTISLQPFAKGEVQLPAVVLAKRQGTAKDTLYLIPRCLIAGIGCRKDTTEPEIGSALQEACCRAGLDSSRIDLIASTTAKSKEAGLLHYAASKGLRILFFGNAAMQQCINRYRLEESAFVKKTIGIGNVCEAAALCATEGKGGRFALIKTKFEKVTVSLLWQNMEPSR